MKYVIKNWIKTAAWEGALIEDENGKQYLTSGIYKWKMEPHRTFTVIDQVVPGFLERWKENFPYEDLIGAMSETEALYIDRMSAPFI